jgi:hypothetical protein
MAIPITTLAGSPSVPTEQAQLHIEPVAGREQTKQKSKSRPKRRKTRKHASTQDSPLPVGQEPLDHAADADHSKAETKTKRNIAKVRSPPRNSPLHVGKGVYSSVQISPMDSAVTKNEWSKLALRAYTRYPKLYGERKYARDAPSQAFRFMALPGDIRNQIYGHLLLFNSIELAPKTPTSDTIKAAAWHYRNIHRKNVKPALRILRTSKTINHEAAGIFYGENEFRFSALHGIDVLPAFCSIIGKANIARLRKITEHIALHGRYEGQAGELDRRTRASQNCL